MMTTIGIIHQSLFFHKKLKNSFIVDDNRVILRIHLPRIIQSPDLAKCDQLNISQTKHYIIYRYPLHSKFYIDLAGAAGT